MTILCRTTCNFYIKPHSTSTTYITHILLLIEKNIMVDFKILL